jgi:hypothetical protein
MSAMTRSGIISFDELTSLLMNPGSLLLNQGERANPLRNGNFCRWKTEYSLQLWQNQPAFPQLQGETGSRRTASTATSSRAIASAPDTLWQ